MCFLYKEKNKTGGGAGIIRSGAGETQYFTSEKLRAGNE